MKTDFPDSPPPAEIEARSFAIIDSEVPEPRPFQGSEWEVARRLVHTSADFELLGNIRFHPKAIESGMAALRRGCRIVTDTEMARVGIPVRRLDPLGATALCLLNEPGTASLARERGLTRTAAAVDVALEGRSRFLPMGVHGSIMAIGNAPTALLRLLRQLQDNPEAQRPSLIIGMPVGFVNAEESKECLMRQEEIPYITIQGRKGGSPLAAATCNALAVMALRK